MISSKTFIWIGMFVGSTLGGILPALWGGDVFSYIIFSGIGALAGIWAGYKLSNL